MWFMLYLQYPGPFILSGLTWSLGALFLVLPEKLEGRFVGGISKRPKEGQSHTTTTYLAIRQIPPPRLRMLAIQLLHHSPSS